jgi:catechol 2,3-dioxygenase-like lactoylglutathione lyase family enzyme
MKPFSSVVVGVANLDRALVLWVDEFGLEEVARRDGPDAGLATLWGLDASAISRQAVVKTPGVSRGQLHLVEFSGPAEAVRDGAAPTDCCPKNLDVYVHDLPARMLAMQKRGFVFKNERHSEVVTPGGVRFRESHLPAHDHINVVLLELFGESLDYSPQGFAAVGLLISIVPDVQREKDFYQQVLGLEKLHDNLLQGPEVEQMIGLPPGAALDASVWGQPHSPMGQMEIIEYRGAAGADLYPRTRPPALGILHVVFESEELTTLCERLRDSTTNYVEHGDIATLAGAGERISFNSPAGLRIEVFSANPE